MGPPDASRTLGHVWPSAAYTRAVRDEAGAFDAVVCGGGTAGCVVAARLVGSGRRVLLLEAGPDHGAHGSPSWPAELTDATTIPTTHDWGYRSGDELPGRDLAYERAKVIGGSSSHNGCTISWGHRVDYDGWSARGLAAWSADDLEPLFLEASRRMRVRRFSEDELSPMHRGFIETGVALGFPDVDDLETLDGVPGVCAEPSNSPDGTRWNAAFAYLDPVRADPSLAVRADVLVDRVRFDRTRAVGVRAIETGEPFEVSADLVVLACGTYGSPAILLRSGVGPADDVAALGTDVVADVPGVGRNLQDHPSYELSFAPSAELRRQTAAFAATGRPVPDEQAFAKASSARAQAAGEPFDLHVFPEVAMDRRPGVFTALLTPRSRGALSLSSLDPAAAPHLDHAYLSDPDGHDLEALVDGVELARSFAASEPFASLLDRELAPGPGTATRHDLRDAVRRGVVHYWHPVGTCAMGAGRDREAVTDADGRVRGVDGLAVADASVMPVTPRATTNLPTVVVAERIARALA
jgi:choline dehydrogenase